MQKFLLSGLTALAAVFATATDVSAAVKNTSDNTKDAPRMTISHNQLFQPEKSYLSAPAYAAETAVTVTPEVIEVDKAEFTFVGAVRTIDGVAEIYGGEVWDGEADSFTLPQGTYTFFAYGFTRRSMGSIFLVKKDQKVEEGFTISFATNEGTNTIDVKQISPSGEVLKTDYDEDYTLSVAEDVITYGGKVASWNGMDLYTDQMNYINTNLTENDPELQLTRLHVAPSLTDGMLFSICPVDFSKKEIGSTQDGWEFAKYDIIDTPAKIKDMDAWREEGMPEAEIPYTFIKYYMTFNNGLRATAGIGETGPIYAGNVGFWQPADYEGAINYVVLPAGSVITGHESSIKCMPVTYVKGEGVVQLGYNPVFEPDFFFTSEGKVFDTNNPYLTAKATPAVIGNCTPALVTVSNGTSINFSFTGRHGEALPIDSWYSAKYFFNDIVGATNKTSVSINGKTVSSKRENYPDKIDWAQKGTYKITFSTDNILIDNELPGLVKGTLTYDSETYQKLVPSVTYMTFTNEDGNVTDRFGSADEATMELYAAVTKYNYSSTGKYKYYDFSAPAEVKVEWAPTGTTDYVALTPVADESKDFAPGYGSYYSVDMSDVTVENGWIDVRITVTAESGAEQVQTITPAMCLDSKLSGINVVVEGNFNATAEYYNLQGIRINQPNAGQLVIRRQGNKTTKLIAE